MDTITAGDTFGKWTVITYEGIQNKRHRWICKCECGTRSSIEAYQLLAGRSTKCKDCHKRQIKHRIHGHTKKDGSCSSEYSSWASMIQRCNNPNKPSYARYGGRGIKVCERWHTFAFFLEDMGLKSAPGMTIERRDNDGHYEPTNCYWADFYHQSRNRSSNRSITANGRTMLICEWAKQLGGSPGVIGWRLRKGWTEEQAVTTPIRPMKFT